MEILLAGFLLGLICMPAHGQEMQSVRLLSGSLPNSNQTSPNQTHSAHAPQAAGDGFRSAEMPCLSGVCLGDPIAKHVATVNWDVKMNRRWKESAHVKATKKYGVSFMEQYVKNISPQYRDELWPYLGPAVFDANLVKLLNESGAVFCRHISMEGSFISESGHWTRVIISPSARHGGFVITGIDRWFRNKNDRAETSRMEAEILRKHPWLENPVSTPPWKTGWSTYNSGELSFGLFANDEGERLGFGDSELSRQAACTTPSPSMDY